MTMVEILLYLALLSILVFVLTDMLISILSTRLESESYATVEQDGRFLLTRLEYDIPQASSISQPPSLGATTSALVMVVNGVTYTYQASGSSLALTNNNGTDMLQSSETSISALSFFRLGNPSGKDTIQVQFTLTGKTQRTGTGVGDSQTFSTTVSRR